MSILRTENGRIGQANFNKNGSYDFGPMQINSSWLPILSRYGYTQNDLQYNACENLKIGTWILANEIANGQSLWTGIGDYHSHTAYYNFQYQYKVQTAFRTLVREINI